jgi:lysophospholipase L1-like esterase
VTGTRSLLPAAVVSMIAVVATVLGAPAARADPRPTAVVALGDSAAAGEGAGGYEPGTRGERGNWCHRSVRAYVHRTGLAAHSINLACSGASAADVGFGPATHYTEGSQAARLVEIGRRYRVSTVVVQAGANDDAALFDTGIACIVAFLDPTTRPCRRTLGPPLGERLAATGRKVEAAVRDVREAMRRAGYVDGGYELVVTSYAAPITERMVAAAVRGCPYSRADAQWGRTQLFPRLSLTLRGVAERTGARFLDLQRAAQGREACSRVSPSQEWHRRLTVDPAALAHGGLDALGYHLAQESFHPNATGHAETGRCLDQFVRSGEAFGSCVVGRDGRLQLETPQPAGIGVSGSVRG